MSFQEQKFPIALGTVTALATIGLLWWGMKSNKSYAAAQGTYEDAVGQISQLSSETIPPTENNEVGLRKSVTAFREEVEKLQKSFDRFRAPSLTDTEPTAFQNKVLEVAKETSDKFAKAKTELPGNFYLGFDEYTTKLPQTNQTGLLEYELGAWEDMFTKLAEAAPAKLGNVYRQPLAEESGKAEEPEGDYRAHSIEVTFSGREESLRRFLASLDNSDKYFFVVRSMRVRNEKDKAPNANDAQFPDEEQASQAEADENPFGTGLPFAIPDEDDAGNEGDADAEAEAAMEQPSQQAENSSMVLEQVLGGEAIDVFLRIDVLQFLKAQDLPKL